MCYEKIIVSSDILRKGKTKYVPLDAIVSSTDTPGQLHFELLQTECDIGHLRLKLGPSSTITWQGRTYIYESCYTLGWKPKILCLLASDEESLSSRPPAKDLNTMELTPSKGYNIHSFTTVKITSSVVKKEHHRVFMLPAAICDIETNTPTFLLGETMNQLERFHLLLGDDSYIITNCGAFKVVEIHRNPHDLPEIKTLRCEIPSEYKMTTPHLHKISLEEVAC